VELLNILPRRIRYRNPYSEDLYPIESIETRLIYDLIKDEYGPIEDFIKIPNILTALAKTSIKESLGLDPDPKAEKFQDAIFEAFFQNPKDEKTPSGKEVYDIFKEYEDYYDLFNLKGQKVIKDLLKRGLYNERAIRGYSTMQEGIKLLEEEEESKSFPERHINVDVLPDVNYDNQKDILDIIKSMSY
tara:strand:+ start:1048 stop:1611 length:564 start_codon:yes stop_codon:yes gene_type:complete